MLSRHGNKLPEDDEADYGPVEMRYLTSLPKPSPGTRAINALAFLAFTMLVLRTGLVDRPAWFPGAGRLGELLYELSLAFLGAWIFNLLVVVRPRKRDRDAIYSAEGNHIAEIAFSARAMIAMMARSVGDGRVAPPEPDMDFVTRTLKHVAPDDPCSESFNVEDGQKLLWIEVIASNHARIDRRIEQLIPVYPYFEPELVSLLNKIRPHRFHDLVTSVAIQNRRLPNLSDFDVLLYDHWRACHRLECYYRAKVKPKIDQQDLYRDRHWIGIG